MTEPRLTERITIRLTETEYAQIFAIAEEEQRKGADMARILLAASIRAWRARDFSPVALYRRIQRGLKGEPRVES